MLSIHTRHTHTHRLRRLLDGLTVAARRKCDRHAGHDDALVTQLLTFCLRQHGWGKRAMVVLGIETHPSTTRSGNGKIVLKKEIYGSSPI